MDPLDIYRFIYLHILKTGILMQGYGILFVYRTLIRDIYIYIYIYSL